MGYAALRDDFQIKLTKFGFGDLKAEGTANISFIESTTASGSLPVIGDVLHDYGYYNGGEGSGSYPNIKAEFIEQVPYGVEGGNDTFKYTVTYNSADNVNNQTSDFSSEVTVLSYDKPSMWRYGVSVASDSTISGSPFGTLDGKISKLVPSGRFTIKKLVNESQLSSFHDDFIACVGKINNQAIFALGESSSSGIEFQRGQVLCYSYNMQDRLPSGLYAFDVEFKWRVLGASNINGVDIDSDDFNYVLAPNSENDKPGGWAVPVQLNGTDTTGATLSSKPFIYTYASSGAFTTLISTDYSAGDES